MARPSNARASWKKVVAKLNSQSQASIAACSPGRLVRPQSNASAAGARHAQPTGWAKVIASHNAGVRPRTR